MEWNMRKNACCSYYKFMNIYLVYSHWRGVSLFWSNWFVDGGLASPVETIRNYHIHTYTINTGNEINTILPHFHLFFPILPSVSSSVFKVE